MPTIVDAYKTDGNDFGVGKVLGSLADSLWGKNASASALAREKYREAERQNLAMQEAMRFEREGGYDPRNPEHRATYLANPDLPAAQRFVGVTRMGAQDPRSSDLLVGSGMAWGSTPRGTREELASREGMAARSLAENARQFDVTPRVIGTDRGPVWSTNAQAVGQPAVESLTNVKGNAARIALNQPGGLDAVSPVTRSFIDAEPKEPNRDRWTNIWFVDSSGRKVSEGVWNGTDPLSPPPGTHPVIVSPLNPAVSTGVQPSVRAEAQKSNLALARLNKVSDYAQGLITSQNVGVPGLIKKTTQDITQIASGLAEGLGIRVPEDMVNDIKTRAAGHGITPDRIASLFQFDPNLPKLSTAYYALVMTAADALAGGMNKASDRDIKIVTNMVGSPTDLFASSESLNARMEALRDLVGRLSTVNTPYAGGAGESNPAAPRPRKTSNGVSWGVKRGVD